MGFTEVTSDLYYSNGSLGTLKIPSIGLTVSVYEGTDSAALAKGAGHFEGDSIWAGKNGCAVDLFIQLSGLFEVSLDYLILGKYDSALLRDTERKLLIECVEDAIVYLERVKTAL